MACGFGATSYRDISIPLGITKAAIYYHYPSKDDLLMDLVGPLLRAADELINRTGSAQPPIPAKTFLDRYLRVLLAHRTAATLVTCDVSVTNHATIGPRLRDHHRRLTEILAGGPSPDQASHARIAAALGALRWPLTAPDSTDLATLRRVAVAAAAAALGPTTPDQSATAQRRDLPPHDAAAQGEPTELKADLELPPERRSVAAARGFIADTLSHWHREQAADVATLLTSELVTNAVVHAQTDIIVSISSPKPPPDADDDRIRIEIRDHDVRMPAPSPGTGLSARGRGLTIVDSLATAWGMERRRATKTVWFEIPAG